MYMCDGCGYSREKPGLCPHCQSPLTMYTKDEQNEYKIDMEEAMRLMSEYKWYV
jgi:transcription initiation factor IIE alpha subunit